MPKENKKNTSLRLENKVLKELKIVAIEEDTSVQAIVETLIQNFLKNHKKKKRKDSDS
ncbi:MAG: CopG family transcriptional regulator [Desulfobulbaceae bacterium]|nr:MAG: CopG family transcriptional regulator [Desulfobulbaceae bacterium]